MRRAVFSLLLLPLLLLAGAPSASAAAAGDQLLANSGLEAGGNAPAAWAKSSWGTNHSTFTWSTDAPHSGARSARVEVSSYTDGDSKWVPDAVPVTGGGYYTFSDWYKANASTAVSVYYELAGDAKGEGHWANLFSGIAPASEWTQYKTGFTMPAGAVRAQFVHFIARKGWLQTDDYALTEAAAPAGFSKPMVSLTFDDGSQGFWDNARTPLKQKGFATTQYIPTGGLTSTPRDPFLMTPEEITTLAREGHEIGAHSVTHPLLTTRTDAQLATEFGDSKQVLEALPGVGTVRNFAYPYGDYDARVIKAAQAAGYRSGRSVEAGYNSTLDLELFDIRVQNVTPDTTVEEFKSWLAYAKAHNYWLVLVYHEVQPDAVPRCTGKNSDPDPCLGDFDTQVGAFKAQLDAISEAGLGPNVMTVQQALDAADAEMHPPAPGGGETPPAAPTTSDTPTAAPSGSSDPGGAPAPTPAPTMASADRTAPRIRVTRPASRSYKLRQTLRVRISATDASGSVRWTASVRRSGGKARAVRQGARLRLSRTGRYVLRVTATDRAGNVARKTVRFRVVRR